MHQSYLKLGMKSSLITIHEVHALELLQKYLQAEMVNMALNFMDGKLEKKLITQAINLPKLLKVNYKSYQQNLRQKDQF